MGGMTDETMRKLGLLARIEQTIALGLRDTLGQAESDEVRSHMVRLASSHEWHAQALLDIQGVERPVSEKVDREMRVLLERMERPREYGDFLDTLSNVEREQEVRIEELLGHDLDEEVERILSSAHRDIEGDYRIFLERADALGHA